VFITSDFNQSKVTTLKIWKRILGGSMKITKFASLAGIALALLIAFAAASDTFAQGRGGGRPAGNPGGGGGRPDGVGRPTNPGVDRGISTASERSGGRSDRGLETARTNSGGRSDEGLERARLQRENSLREADREIGRNPRIGKQLRMNANDLRRGYQAALATNPDLKFGQYVAAHMVARNLNSRFPNVTAGAILSRLAEGDSIGEALRDLGVSRDEAKRAEKEAKQRLKNR
jgi:hypothetical protein